MEALYKLEWDVGRGFQAEGLFIARKEYVDCIMGKTIYFGEICGKHSDVEIEMNSETLTMVTDSQSLISELRGYFFTDTISGHNPFDYYEEYE